ncbi:MAG: ABC transporter permease subunit [Alphaproteobacteria bacterium]|nr:MAG: ABC transporter permease subunit [Alphaproteobacteria bacterium]
MVAAPAWILAVASGALLGMDAAMCEGRAFGRAVDWGIRIVFTTPFLLVLIAMGALIGRGLGSVFLVVVLLGWAYSARHARADAREALHAPYAHAALTMGFPTSRIVIHVLVPTCVLPVIAVSGCLLVEIMALDMALSLFGFGPSPPTPTLGSMLTDGLRYLSAAPWIITTPLVIVCLVCVGVRWASHSMASPMRSLP